MVLIPTEKGENQSELVERKMAKTKSSKRGVQNKKIVVVKGYKKKDGTVVKVHRRSTPE